MTLQELQEYLDVEKWEESARRSTDMCGRYARCMECNRFEDYPCARAHNRLEDKKARGATVPVWFVPEPNVQEKFGETIAQEEVAPVEKPIEEEVAIAQEEIAPVKKAARKTGGVRVLVFQKKQG